MGVEKLFCRLSREDFVRKLLNCGSAQTHKFAEITVLVPFSTPTPGYNSWTPGASGVNANGLAAITGQTVCHSSDGQLLVKTLNPPLRWRATELVIYKATI